MIYPRSVLVKKKKFSKYGWRKSGRSVFSWDSRIPGLNPWRISDAPAVASTVQMDKL